MSSRWKKAVSELTTEELLNGLDLCEHYMGLVDLNCDDYDDPKSLAAQEYYEELEQTHSEATYELAERGEITLETKQHGDHEWTVYTMTEASKQKLKAYLESTVA
jgi:hypothetical protein